MICYCKVILLWGVEVWMLYFFLIRVDLINDEYFDVCDEQAGFGFIDVFIRKVEGELKYPDVVIEELVQHQVIIPDITPDLRLHHRVSCGQAIAVE